MLTLTLSTLVMLALFASPALADFSLTLNDIKAGIANPVLVVDGRGLVSTDTIALLFGADVAVENGTIRVVENDRTLVMQIDNLEATLNDAPLTLYIAPQVIDNKVMVPLSSICEALGASISCNAEQERINVVYKETRKGLSPQEVMDKYMNQYKSLNTYRFKGTQDITMDMTAAGLPSGTPEKMNMNIAEKISGSFSQNPIQAYMNINIKMDGGALAAAKPAVTDQTMELVMTDRMYMKMPDGQWVEMDLNGLNLKDMMQNQGSLQDLQGMITELQKNQVIMSFDNDKNRQGEDYWIIESTIDSETFSNMFKGVIGQLNQMMPTTTASDNQEFQNVMNEMMKSMKMNMKIKIWVDPDTYLARYGDGIMDVQMNMPIPAQNNGTSGTLNMNMQGTNSLEYYDYGAKVTLPDTSGAISFDKYLTIQTSQIKAN
ncbi:MAG: copper amine oxidase N-terminal domain-containing protein [Syntrophomonas sp.]